MKRSHMLLSVLIVFNPLTLALVGWHIAVVSQPSEDDRVAEQLTASENVRVVRVSRPTPAAILAGDNDERGPVYGVYFTGHVTQEQIELIAQLKECHTVSFDRATYQNSADLRLLAAMPKLQTAFFEENSITVEVLNDCLPRLKALRCLFIRNNSVDDRCVDGIARAPALRTVFIAGTQITPTGTERLRAARSDVEIDTTPIRR